MNTPQYPPNPAQAPQPLDAYNPFDTVEFLPGLGLAVLCVVLAYLFLQLLLLPA